MAIGVPSSRLAAESIVRQVAGKTDQLTTNISYTLLSHAIHMPNPFPFNLKIAEKLHRL
jgi:hypothetical protein